MGMELLKRGGLARMVTIEGQEPILVKWVKKKPSAGILFGPSVYRHRYYGTAQAGNVCDDCEGRENAPHTGMGMQFPFGLDECGCPDWYPETDLLVGADCPGIAPLGGLRVAAEGATENDPSWITGPNGLLPCCCPRPSFVGSANNEFVEIGGVDYATLRVPVGLPGDLLVAVVRVKPPGTTILWPVGWTPWTVSNESPLLEFSWGVAYRIDPTTGGQALPINPLVANEPFGFTARFRNADVPFSNSKRRGTTLTQTWNPTTLDPDRVNTMMLVRLHDIEGELAPDSPTGTYRIEPPFSSMRMDAWGQDGVVGDFSPTYRTTYTPASPWVSAAISIPSKKPCVPPVVVFAGSMTVFTVSGALIISPFGQISEPFAPTQIGDVDIMMGMIRDSYLPATYPAGWTVIAEGAAPSLGCHWFAMWRRLQASDFPNNVGWNPGTGMSQNNLWAERWILRGVEPLSAVTAVGGTGSIGVVPGLAISPVVSSVLIAASPGNVPTVTADPIPGMVGIAADRQQRWSPAWWQIYAPGASSTGEKLFNLNETAGWFTLASALKIEQPQ